MTKEKVLNLLKEEKPFLMQNFKVKKIGIFGSFLKDETKADDLDIYVEFEKKSFDNIAGLWNYLEKKFGKVDIYYPHKFSKKEILKKIQKDIIYG